MTTNKNAGLYRCTVVTDGARCTEYGATRRWTTLDASGTAVASTKADPDSKQRAFCDEHAVAITEGKAVQRRGLDASTVPAGWLGEAEREALRQCDPALWTRLGVGAAGRIGSDLADDVRDARRVHYARVVATRAAVRADLSPRDAVALGEWDRTDAREIAKYGPTFTLLDAERVAMSAHVNIPEALAVDFTDNMIVLADTASTEPDVTGLGWDREVLDTLDPAHRATLLAFAASTEPDGIEPTRNQASEWTRGVMIPRECDDLAVKVAALAYLTAKMARDAYEAA